MPTRRITGKAHKETIRSPKYIDKGFTLIKKPLTSIKLSDLDNMFGKDRDYKLYEGLKNRLLMFKGDSQKAFAEPFYKPTRDGSRGPIVRSVKIKETTSTGVLINGGKGIADNNSMIRIDVFSKDKKYYIVPVYVADRVRGSLPNRAIAAGKPENEWTIIDSNFIFCFSLYPNDLVKVELKDKLYLGYYRGCHRVNGTINLEAHDRSWRQEGIGVKAAKKFEKYQVDLLGKHYPVKGEHRLELA